MASSPGERPHDALPYFPGSPSSQISHLSIARSQEELVEDKSIDVSIQNVSMIFKGTLGHLQVSTPIQ